VPDNAGLQMGSGDFTIEFWINYNSITGYQTPFSKGYTAAGDILLQTGNGNGIMVVYLSGSAVITESTGAVIGQWYHYALVRSGTTVTLYRDGVSRGTATSSVNFNTTDQAGIGATGKAPGGNIVGAFAVNGYMSNVRVVKGTAIVPPVGGPTSPLTAVSGTQLLTCQSNKYRDNSTNNFTLTRNGNASVVSFNPFRQNTGKSLYFDGTGDYLMAAVNNQSLNFGNSDFCVEFWMKTTATAFLVIGNTGASWQIAATGSSLYWVTSYNTANLMSRSLSGYLDNAWHHFMIRRVSGVTYMYFDGVQQGAGVSDTTNYAPTATIGVGYTGTAYTAMNGYIADLRVTKGNARTANTAPTTAYTSK
jgi:Concanavalin A-like lectin/glucanases superfamily